MGSDEGYQFDVKCHAEKEPPLKLFDGSPQVDEKVHIPARHGSKYGQLPGRGTGSESVPIRDRMNARGTPQNRSLCIQCDHPHREVRVVGIPVGIQD